MKQWLTLSILKNNYAQYGSLNSRGSSGKMNLKLTGQQRSFRANKLGFIK